MVYKNFKIFSICILICLTVWGLYRWNRSQHLNQALAAAVRAGDTNVVLDLLDQGADPNAIDQGSDLPVLMSAALHGNLEMVKALVSKGGQINRPAPDGRTALMEAAWHGKIDIVAYLVQNGADINHQDSQHGSTALIDAAMKGHLPVVDYLLAKGADVNRTDKVGFTALRDAIFHRRTAVAKRLLQEPHIVVDPQEQTSWSKGRTPLMWAARTGQTDVVQMLLHKGAQVHVEDAGHNTAAMLAEAKGHQGIAQLIRAYAHRPKNP